MKIIPAIDLQNGQCVRLFQGDFTQLQQYALDPLQAAYSFYAQGARELHIVDLDGAKNARLSQVELMTKIAKEVPLNIQAGGGIRTKKQIEYLLSQGIAKVVIGSMAVTQSTQVKEWLQIFGADKIILALDVKLNEENVPLLMTNGWQEKTTLTLWELLELYADSDLQQVLCTDITKDGTLNSPNFELYKICQQRFPKVRWQASGGVANLEDLSLLQALQLDSVIVGKAFYENRFSLPQALARVSVC